MSIFCCFILQRALVKTYQGGCIEKCYKNKDRRAVLEVRLEHSGSKRLKIIFNVIKCLSRNTVRQKVPKTASAQAILPSGRRRKSGTSDCVRLLSAVLAIRQEDCHRYWTYKNNHSDHVA